MEPSKEKLAIEAYWERFRERKRNEGTLEPFTPSNGLAHPNWDSDNRNVIKTKREIPDDASELFDSEGFYTGFKK